MANNIVTVLTNQTQFKLVNVMTGFSALQKAKIINVNIKWNSKLFRNRLETGQEKIDGRVILPIEVDVEVYCETADSIDEINQMLLNNTDIHNLITRGIAANNLIIERQTIKQEASVISATPITFRMKQVLLQSNTLPAVANQGDASTLIGGIRSTIQVAEDNIATLYGKTIGAIF